MSIVSAEGQMVTVATNTSLTEPSLNIPVPPPPGCGISVYPSNVHFDGVQPGFAYVMAISVRNVGVDSRRIRLVIPKSNSFFKLRYEPAGALARGIDIRAEIEFRIREDEPELQSGKTLQEFFSDKLVVTSGKDRLEVPLTAALPAPSIHYDPFVNLGLIALDQSGTKEIEFRNVGDKAGSFIISYDHALPVKIRPLKCSLEPGQSINIQVDVDGKSLGPVRVVASVEVENQPARILDISAQIVEQRLELVLENGGGILGGVEFGSLFYGQTRVVRALLVNTGPHPIAYSSSFDFLEGVHERMPHPPGYKETAEDDNEEEFRAMAIVPAEGLIEPMGQSVVQFIYKPRQRDFHKGFTASFPATTRTIALRAVLDAPEANQKILVEMTGRAVMPQLIPSQTMLDFGECPMNDHRDISVELKNPSELPLPFSFPILPLVHVIPASGTILPGQAQAVVVSYRPTQMGPLKRYLDISVAGGIESVPLTLLGSSGSLVAKSPLVKGVDKVPEDFAPKFEFVKPEEIKKQKDRKSKKEQGWHRSKPYEDVDMLVSTSWDEEETRPSAMAQYTFSLQGLARRDEHRDKYNNFLKESRMKREAKAQAEEHAYRKTKLGCDTDNPEGLDLGLARGMKEPQLRMPLPSDQLWLNRPPAGSEVEQTGGRKKLPVDENRLMTKKFKPHPTTQAEVRDCTKTLSPQDLLNIVTSHKVLDFGRVSVDSTVAKNFAVGNFLHHCILVTLGKLDPEIRGSGPASQVVPEGLVAGFDIHFSSPAVGPVKRMLSFTVNDHHIFKFTVTAEVVPLELKLSHREVTMHFPEDSLASTVTETVFMENPGTASCDFYWAVRGAFSVKPEQGSIPAGSKMEAVITWRPVPGFKNDEILSLSVPGGKDTELHVVGQCAEAKVVILDKKLDFGIVAVGLKQEKTIRVKNQGNMPAVVTFDTTMKEFGCSANPEVFRLVNAGETAEVKVTLNPPAPRNYQGMFVVFNVRGGRNLRIPLHAESVVPDVALEQDAFDFGGVALGADYSLPVSLINNGSIPASLVLDLSSHDGFSISAEDLKVGSTSNEVESVDKATLIRGLTDSKEDDDDILSSSESTKWHILVPPSMVLTFSFTFQPDSVGSYNFSLPLGLQGVAGGSPLSVPVRAQALHPRLVVSSANLDFGDRVVSKDTSGSGSYHKEIQFANATRGPLCWEIDDGPIKEMKQLDPHGPNTFFVSPRYGELSPGEAVTVRVTFSPKRSLDYKLQLPIFLADQQDKSRAYMNLRLRGSGVRPNLSFDREHVIMPIVPLGVKSRAKFHVINNGFPSIELSHKFPPYTPVQFELTYPEGKQLGTGIHKVPVIIEFKAAKPVSINVRVEFSDSEGHRFSLPVLACADNCSLTISRFLGMYGDKYTMHKREEGPVMLYHTDVIKAIKGLEAKSREREKQKRAEERQATIKALLTEGGSQGGDSNGDEDSKKGKISKAPSSRKIHAEKSTDSSDELTKVIQSQEEMQTELGKEDPPFSEKVLDSLVSWLNFNVMQTRINRFPAELYESNGRLLFEALETMAGKAVPGKAKSFSSSRKERILQLVSQYGDMMLFLKEKGALLNTVPPENLLGKEDFIIYKELLDDRRNKENHVTPRQAKDDRVLWEKSWSEISLESWTMLLYQSIRVFMLSRVNSKSFKSLPGVSVDKVSVNPKQEAALATCNSYNLSEQLLIRWLNYHVNATLQTITKSIGVCDFERDLRDGSVFCHALASHVPFLNKPGKPLDGFVSANKVMDLQTTDARVANAKRIVECLNLLQINYGLTTETLLHGTGPELMMLGLHLYQVLPQFIPKANVEFRSILGTRNRKLIELQNPNKVPIKYHVTIEGSKDFRIQNDTVEIGPQGSVEYPVDCEPKTSGEVEARLTFWTQRVAGRAASNMVFALRSHVIGRKPTSTVNYNGFTYEPSTITVEVKNPFASDCIFALSTVQNFMESIFFKGNDSSASFNKTQMAGDAQSTQSLLSKTLGSSSKGKGSSKKGSPTPDRLKSGTDEENEFVHLLKNPFFMTQETLRVKAKESANLALQMVAFFPGVYTCQLVFSDVAQGEFAIDVVATVDLPRPLQKLTCDMSSEEGPLRREVKLPSSNPALQKAISATCDRLPFNSRQRARLALTSFFRPATNASSVAPYRLEMDSPFWVCPPVVDLYFDAPPSGGAPPPAAAAAAASKANKSSSRELVASIAPPSAADATADQSNRAIVALHSQDPGSYPARMFLYPLQTPVPDFRVFEVEAELLAAKVSTSFTFRSPARQSITQEIPVTNNGSTPWELHVVIEGSHAFTGANTLTVPAMARGDRAARYKVTFTPLWLGEQRARLVFKSLATGESFDYTLTGIGEEPLAEAGLEIRCKARDSTEEVIQVRNPLREATVFKVESDLPYVGGAAEVTIPGLGTADYSIWINPQMGGVYSGSITFTAPDGQFVWYTVQLTVGSPQAENTIEAKSRVRQALAIELVIENPLPESLELDVVVEGEYLLGDDRLVIDANASKAYQLVYSPLLPKTHHGSVAFLNPKVGEFWYKVHLTALPAEPIVLPSVSCAVGDKGIIPVTIENPTGQSVAFVSRVDNKRNFSVEPTKVTVGPYGSTAFNIVYSPSSLSVPEVGTVEMSHPEIGTWQYHVEGTGELPGIMPEHTATSVVGQLNSYMFPFRNPFNTPLNLDILLRIDELPINGGAEADGQSNDTNSSSQVSEEQKAAAAGGAVSVAASASDESTGAAGLGNNPSPLDPVFNLLLKKNTQVPLAAFASMQIPLSFFPPTITARSATLEIRGAYRGHELTWVFPIKGIAEAPTQRRAFSIKCKAKRSVRQEIDLELKGLEQVNKMGEEFEHDLILPANVSSLLSKWLTVAPLKTDIAHKDEKLRYLLTFEPYKPICTTVEFVVMRKSGGRWRYELRVEALEPEPDDVIPIEAAIHTTTILNFRLCNRHLNFAPFQAYFSTDSAYDITVTPNNGVLPPFGSEGTVFSLTFSPHEYGKHERARLFIETDEDLWSYEIKGTYPGFEAPQNVEPKVDCHISKHIGERLTMINTTNIVRKNMLTRSLRSPSEARRKLRVWKKLDPTSTGTQRFFGAETATFAQTITSTDNGQPY